MKKIQTPISRMKGRKRQDRHEARLLCGVGLHLDALGDQLVGQRPRPGLMVVIGVAVLGLDHDPFAVQRDRGDLVPSTMAMKSE
jgi:hypothetical protein